MRSNFAWRALCVGMALIALQLSGPRLSAIHAVGDDAPVTIEAGANEDSRTKDWEARWEKNILGDEHNRYCDKEMGEEIGWTVSPFLNGFYYGYKATHDRKWVDHFVDWSDSWIKRGIKEPDGYLGWPKADGASTTVVPGLYTDNMLGDAMGLKPAVLMADTILKSPALRMRYGDKARGYIRLAEQMFEKWDRRGCWREVKSGGLWVVPTFGIDQTTGHWTDGYSRRNSDGFSLPDNKENIIAEWLLAMYDVTKKPIYRERAERWFRLMRSRMKLRDDGKYYAWDYWDPAGPWDYKPDGSTKHWIGVHPNGGYYDIDVEGIVDAYEHKLVFTQTEIARLIATNRDFMWNHQIQGARFQRIDGGEAVEPWKNGPGVLWHALVPHDVTLRKVFEANHNPDNWGGLSVTPWYLERESHHADGSSRLHRTPKSAPQKHTALSTEEFLNHLGVNTHLAGLTHEDPWNTNVSQIGAQLNYIGVRIDRDWASSPALGRTWKDVQKAWSPYGRFWTSIDEGGPAFQRRVLGYQRAIYQAFPGLIYAMGGPNEEDDAYPQGQGATLPDSALVQQMLYKWAHAEGRNIPVSQMEFGAGWTAANNWQGDYNPGDTGIRQNYVPAPADFASAHTYLHMPGQRPADVLNQLRALANLATPGKPVAHTEFGAYSSANFSVATFGQFLVMGALDSVAAGDAAYIVYGLQDSAPENTYGFFDYPGNTAHPAANYFHTLTTLLKSASGSYGPGSKPTFRPDALDASFSNPLASHLVMQKPTGEFVIADWSEQPMNGSEHADVDIVSFGRSFATVRVYDVQNGTVPIAMLHNVSRTTLRMKPNDTYLVVLSR